MNGSTNQWTDLKANEELFPADATEYYKHIKQGGLGDFWLLAAFAAIAEYPDRIHDIFNNQRTVPDSKKLVLNFWNSGRQMPITIDT